jgi:hypothetical protein
MKKEKVIRLTENELVNLIKKVIREQDNSNDLTNKTPEQFRNDVLNLAGSEVLMFNSYGLNKYTGEGGIFKGKRTSENYKIKGVGITTINNLPTVEFTVDNISTGEGVSGKTGTFLNRDKQRDTEPIKFRWNCNSVFEKGLGEIGQPFKRKGGIKEDYLNNDLAKVITSRPFCTYKGTPDYVAPIYKNASYRGAPR